MAGEQPLEFRRLGRAGAREVPQHPDTSDDDDDDEDGDGKVKQSNSAAEDTVYSRMFTGMLVCSMLYLLLYSLHFHMSN